MGRTCAFAFAGAGVGFLSSLVIISMLWSGEPARDTAMVTVCLGAVLAGPAAVAGALIGGVADLKEYFRRSDDEAKEAWARSESIRTENTHDRRRS